MTRAPRRNPQAVAAPRRLAALVVLALAASACDAPVAVTAVDEAVTAVDDAAFNIGGPERSVVCHYDADADMYKALTLPAPAVAAHLSHGDALPGDRLPDDSGVFGPSCEAILDPPPPALPNIVDIHAPSPAAGEYGASDANFGAEPSVAGVAGAVVLVNDGTASPTQGCSPLVGFPAGSIALVDRGTCTFVQKAQNAQAAGAVAMVVVNNIAGPPVTMGGDDPSILIPLVMVGLVDGSAIKAGLPADGTVRRHP
jgi:hypothetical protein